MQEDTYLGNKSDPLSLNLYAYCNNNPLVYYDPTGHERATTTANGETVYRHIDGYGWLKVVNNSGNPVSVQPGDRVISPSASNTGGGSGGSGNGGGSGSGSGANTASASNTPQGTQVKLTLASGQQTTGYITNGVTRMADGSDVPVGSVVHTANGDYMKMEAGKNGVAVTPVPVVQPNGNITTGYISKEDNLTYMLGGTRPTAGSAVATANGNYKMTTNGGEKLPTTVNGTLSQGSSGDGVLALQVELNLRSNAGLALDGKFGSLTQAAVIAFQATAGLSTDGRVGPQTSSALGLNYVAAPKSTNQILSTNTTLSSRSGSGINGQVPLTVQLPNTGGGAVVATAQGILGLKEAITGLTALEALLLGGDNAFDLSISLDVCRSLEGGVHSYSNDLIARKVIDWADGISSYPGSSIPKWQQETGLGQGVLCTAVIEYGKNWKTSW